MVQLLEPATLLYYNDALGPAFGPKHKKYNIDSSAGEKLYVVGPYRGGLLVVPWYKLTNAGKPKGNNFARYFIPEGTRLKESPEFKSSETWDMRGLSLFSD